MLLAVGSRIHQNKNWHYFSYFGCVCKQSTISTKSSMSDTFDKVLNTSLLNILHTFCCEDFISCRKTCNIYSIYLGVYFHDAIWLIKRWRGRLYEKRVGSCCYKTYLLTFGGQSHVPLKCLHLFNLLILRKLYFWEKTIVSNT